MILKKSVIFFILPVAFILGLASCGGAASDAAASGTTAAQSEDWWAQEATAVVEGDKTVNDRTAPITFDEYFTLDFSPEHIEEKSVPGKVNLNTTPASDKTSTNHIPGLRKLSDYETSYSDFRMSLEEYRKTLASMEGKLTGTSDFEPDESDSPKKTFAVAGWGPSACVSPADLHPEFYVEFTQPVIPLQFLDDEEKVQEQAAKVFTVLPASAGHYQWNGTNCLTYILDEPAVSGATYTIFVNGGLTSADGMAISGECQFSVPVYPVEVKRLVPGATPDNPDPEYSSTANLPCKAVENFAMELNSWLTSDEVVKLMTMHVIRDSEYLIKNFNVTSSTGRYNRSNLHYISFNDDIPEGAEVVVSFMTTDALGSGKPFLSSSSLATIKPFGISELTVYDNYIYVRFNQLVDVESVKDGIEWTGGVRLSREDIDCWGYWAYIRHISCSPEEDGVITITNRIRNENGATLKEGRTINWKARDYNGYAEYLDSGTVMLEAQFPHKILFEYMNATDSSRYLVRSVENPLETVRAASDIRKVLAAAPDARTIDTSKKNVRMFEEIDLEPYLVNGRGAVQFLANVQYDGRDRNGTATKNNAANCTTIQVTDLAATVRFGINKAVVMVRSLSDSKPVEGAAVQFSLGTGLYSSMKITTDADGMAIIDIPKRRIDEIFKLASDNIHYTFKPEFTVNYGDDTIVFNLQGHSSWRSGVSTSPLTSAVHSKYRGFMFTDRGLYRPGETITFRGIIKDVFLGSLSPASGNYKVTLKKNTWRSTEDIAILTGSLSDSGGYWGSMDLPEDIEPGSYLLSVQLNGKSVRTITVDVQYFEPLKVQAQLAMNTGTLIAGDVISADFEASYLAGGYLAGADYSASWFKTPQSFKPADKKFRNFSFSIADSYGYQDYIKSAEGSLSQYGSAVITCDTGTDYKPLPYTYTISASATDASNQRVGASGSVLVHPASWYAGIGKPKGLTGFAKKGQELQFPLILVTPEEQMLSDMSLVHGNLTYTFEREYWSYDYQNGVNDMVSARWTKHTEAEQTGEVTAAASQTVTVTPANAGWYTLRVEGKDSQDRQVCAEYDLYVTGSGATWGRNGSLISLTPDQSMYNPGDTAQILMESPLEAGDYLITVEREGIFSEEIRHFDESCSVIEVPIARNYLPVVYVSVSSYSKREGTPDYEYGEVDIGKPKGYYGVTSLYVNPQARAFSIAIDTDKDIYKPGDTGTVTLKATRGGEPIEGAELTVMGVDRAILDLINYHVPNPIEFFYDPSQFPLLVTGGDTRSYLMDPVTYSIDKLQGGDAETEKDEDEQERKDFRSTAFFEPVLVTGADGTVSFTFKVPDNLSTFRVTAFGVKGEFFGLQEDEFAIQNPVNVQAVQPQKLRVRDTAECGVLLTNVTTEMQTVTVSVAVRETEGEPVLAVDGASECTVQVAPGQSSVAYFDIAAVGEGTGSLVYRISCGALKERLVSTLKAEQSWSYDTVSANGRVTVYDYDVWKDTGSVSVAIPSFAEKGKGSLKVTADGTQLGLLSESVRYLFDYPYGCMEQRSSRILPLVLFENDLTDLGMKSKVDNPHLTILDELREWKSVQHENGSFPYWPENRHDDNYYVSLRIAHICAIALNHGYTVKDLSINVDALFDWISRNTSADSSEAPYACYVMSLMNRSDLDGVLSSLYENQVIRDLYTASYAGLAYANKGDRESLDRAAFCASILKSNMKPFGSMMTMSTSNIRYRWYLSETGIMATSMQLLLRLNPDDPMIDRLLFTIQSRQRAGLWSNTATTAQVLESITTYLDVRKVRDLDLMATIHIEGNTLLSEPLKYPATIKPVTVEKSFTDAELKDIPRDTLVNLCYTAEGNGTLYCTAIMKYALPEEIQTARNEGMDVSYTITDMATGTVVRTADGKSLCELESGKDYRVELTVSSLHDQQFVAARVPVPSGCEIRNERFVTTALQETDEAWDRQISRSVILDNEMQYFWDRMNAGTHTVSFTMRAVRRGVYPTIPALAECMYTPDVFGRSDGYIYTVK